MIDGVTSEAFSANTLPPVEVPSTEVGLKDKIIDVSRERYAKPREIVEDRIMRWSENQAKTSKEDDLKISQQPSKNKKGGEKPKKKSKASHDATCSFCNKETTVNFKPDPTRPVYCKECLDLSKAGKIPSPSSIKVVNKVGDKKDEFLSLADAMKPKKGKNEYKKTNQKIEL